MTRNLEVSKLELLTQVFQAISLRKWTVMQSKSKRSRAQKLSFTIVHFDAYCRQVWLNVVLFGPYLWTVLWTLQSRLFHKVFEVLIQKRFEIA